jgi:hypothetical protein
MKHGRGGQVTNVLAVTIPKTALHASASNDSDGTAVKVIAPDALYAPPATRDQFLEALGASDLALSARLALHLTGCVNPLPGMTCGELGLPPGSTYGSAARHVLRRFNE